MRLFRKIFPEKLALHGWIAIAALIAMNSIAYYGSRLFTASWYHYDFTTVIDRSITFIPAFILVYSVLGFSQWIMGYYWSACEDKQTVLFIFGAEILAKIPSLIFFLLIPTTMARPEVTGTDIFSLLVNGLYFLDTPDNLCPSFHCLESYLLLRTLPLLKKAPRWYKKLTPIVSPLVIISILLVKQHLVVDIIGGIAVCEFGLITMKLIFKVLSENSKNPIKKKSIKKTASLYFGTNE